MITYQVEPWSKALPEMMGLASAHWTETATDKDKIGLDPDLDRYACMESQGFLHVITARKYGELVGYYVWIVDMALHHRTIKVAKGDLYWLRQDCRRGFAGIRLFRKSEEYLKSIGVKKLFDVSTTRKEVGRLFEWLGWTKTETVYCKWIGS